MSNFYVWLLILYEGRSINKFPTAPFHQFLK